MNIEGGCHCGAVRFAIAVDPPISVLDCKCPVCAKAALRD